MTPEHLQLFSDQRLEKAASGADDRPPSTDAPREADPAMVRAARFEQRRRAGDVPVRDRYECS